MSFSLDTRKVKYLHNYEAALRHHDSITPIRNSNCRPVAERTKKHFDIRKQGDSIIVRLYRTDIITYTPDNRITLNMGGATTNTISTRAAIHAVTGVTIQGTNPVWVRDHDGKHYPIKNGMQLQAGEYYCNHKIIDPIHPVVHHLNKKAMNLLRKDHAPFIQYLKGFIKLIGEDGFTYEMLKDVELAGSRYISVSAKGTHEQMHGVALLLAHNVKKNPGYYIPNITVRLKDALACFDKHIIRAHKDTVLTRSTVTDGRMVTDRYAWAVG